VSRESVFFGVILLIIGTLGSLAFFSVYGKIVQQQADLELTVADFQKNNAKLKVQLKRMEATQEEP